MKKIIKIIALIIGFLCSSNLYCGTIDPNINDDKYVEYGKDFECILEVMGSYNNKKNLFSASAVAVDSRWILTAAHVVKDSRFVFVYDENQKKAILIDEVICHEDFEEKKFGIADIALCHTTSDIGLSFYPQLYENDNEVNKICSISGYGYTGTFDTGITYNDGSRRAGSNMIDKIEQDLLICTPSKTNKTSLEFLIGSGDSGGGLFIDGKLAGINSCVTAIDKKPDSTYNDEGGHTRISKFISWIKEHIQKKRADKSPLP